MCPRRFDSLIGPRAPEPLRDTRRGEEPRISRGATIATMNSFPSFPAMGIIGVIIAIVIYAGVLALSLWICWAIIRSAVRRALRDHQQWLEQRGR